VTDNSARLAHYPDDFGAAESGAQAGGPATTDQPGVVSPQHGADLPVLGRVPALVLTAEGPRRADLLSWASAHRGKLAKLKLHAPSGIGSMLAEQVGLTSEPLRAGTVGPTGTAGLAAAGSFDGMVAFSDPIELRPGDNTTRSLSRLAVFWDIPIAGNRATADLLLAQLMALYAASQAAPADEAELAAAEVSAAAAARTATTQDPVRGAVQLWLIRATVDDVPGRLAILAASLARRAINILSVQVHLTPDGPVDELLVAASPVLTVNDLSSAVVAGGGRAPRVTPADAHALVDGPTRALALAARVVRSHDELPAALISLLPGGELSWRPDPPASLPEDPTQLWLEDPTGGGYLLSRAQSPFTPAESARAHAMIDVAMTALAQAAPAKAPEPAEEAWQLLLADGTEMTARQAVVDDIGAIVALHARCSLTSRLRRYLAGTNCPPQATLERLVDPAHGYTLVVEDGQGSIVAMANLIWADAERHTAELALLVEDQWQRQRIGTVLARRLSCLANKAGVQTVQSVIHAGNTPMVRIMAGLGHRLHREYEGGMLTLIATLRAQGQTHLLPSSMCIHQAL
jgi:methylglyoxal synthase